MSDQTPSRKRPLCAACLRPQRTCICALAAPVPHDVDVVILQHPLEVRQAKGSARLLHLCLPGSRLIVGEQFSDAELAALLQAPDVSGRPREAMLLYPALPHDSLPEAVDDGMCANPANLRLIVIDATWRKSRRMLYRNPALAQLPRLSLSDPPPARYAIRQAHAPHQLSTFEAVCAALARLENAPNKYDGLLACFDSFVELQQQLRINAGRMSEIV